MANVYFRPPPRSSGAVSQGKRRGWPSSGKTITANNNSETQIPPCACGAPRIFECQVLPSVLHVLDVDKHVVQLSSAKGKDEWGEWYSTGGMDFGSVAIYACSNTETCTEAENFVVVQDTTDDQPKVAADAALLEAGDVVVDEEEGEVGNDKDEDDEFMEDS